MDLDRVQMAAIKNFPLKEDVLRGPGSIFSANADLTHFSEAERGPKTAAWTDRRPDLRLGSVSERARSSAQPFPLKSYMRSNVIELIARSSFFGAVASSASVLPLTQSPSAQSCPTWRFSRPQPLFPRVSLSRSGAERVFPRYRHHSCSVTEKRRCEKSRKVF